MKLVIIVTLVLFVSSCQSLFDTEYNRAHAIIPEARQYVINDLELKDPQEIQFINKGTPDVKNINGITYFWWKNKKGQTVFSAEADSTTLQLFEAEKHVH